MTPSEQHFRRYELIISDIVARYPQPSVLSPINGKSPSYVRQQLREAFEIFLRSPSLTSPIPRDTAQALYNTFTFGNDLDHIHIGPRRKKPQATNAILSPTPSDSPPLTVDCTNFAVASAICLLKDADQFPAVPISLHSLSSDSARELEATYPNISLTPAADPDTYTLL